MATITRGYSFAPTEQVTADKLMALVRNADISGLSFSEFSGTTISISVGTPPTVAGVGWITARYEPPAAGVSDFSTTLSEFNYFINSPTGDVVLFGQTKMETRRFVNATGQAAYGQGFGAHVATANAAVTLTFAFEVGNNAYGNPHCFSVLQQTATTSTTGPGVPRLIMRGYCHINSDGNGPTANTLNYVFADAHADGSLGCTNSSSMDKLLGLCLANDSTAGLRPAWLTGAPVWRG